MHAVHENTTCHKNEKIRLTRTPQRAHPMTEDPEERYYSSFDAFKDHKKYDAPPTHTYTA